MDVSQITADTSAPVTDSTDYVGRDDNDLHSSSGSGKPKGMSDGEIAAAVLVPLLVIGGVATAGFVYMHNKQQQSKPSKLNEFPGSGTELATHTEPRTSMKNPMNDNTVTMTVSASKQDSATATLAFDSEVPGDAAGGWQMYMDAASGQAYYVNSATGESSWELPAGEK